MEGITGSWREKIEIALALLDIDLALTDPCPIAPEALTDPCPIAPEDPARGENESEEDFNAKVCDHAPIRMQYDLDRAK